MTFLLYLLYVGTYVSLTFLDCFYFHQTVEFNRTSQVQLTVMKKSHEIIPKRMWVFLLTKLWGVFGTAPGKGDKTTWMESQLLGVDCRRSQLQSTWVILFCCDFWHSRGRKVLWLSLDHVTMLSLTSVNYMDEEQSIVLLFGTNVLLDISSLKWFASWESFGRRRKLGAH